MPHRHRFHVHFHSHRGKEKATPTSPSPRKSSASSTSAISPVLTLYIPSHDATPLECRIFHPKCFPREGGGMKAAVVAHPYAPLGGCQDDPVVLAVVECLVGRGWIVGCFNFRGAGNSKGKTSWSGHPELLDYGTVASFVASYTAALQPHLCHTTGPITFLHAGYSYGSMIASHSPGVPLVAPEMMSYAQQTAHEWATGETRRSIALVRGKKAWALDSASSTSIDIPEDPVEEDHEVDVVPHYLIISPLLPPVSTALAIPIMFHPFPKLAVKRYNTLAVYGTNDMFSSISKLRKWSEKRTSEAVVGFTSVEVEDGDHFWREGGGLPRLVEVVGEWLEE